MKEGRVKEWKLIVKADVQGSAEALTQSLEQASTEKIKIRVIHGAVGGINESDTMLAAASDAIVIGFHVKADDRGQVTLMGQVGSGSQLLAACQSLRPLPGCTCVRSQLTVARKSAPPPAVASITQKKPLPQPPIGPIASAGKSSASAALPPRPEPVAPKPKFEQPPPLPGASQKQEKELGPPYQAVARVTWLDIPENTRAIPFLNSPKHGPAPPLPPGMTPLPEPPVPSVSFSANAMRVRDMNPLSWLEAFIYILSSALFFPVLLGLILLVGWLLAVSGDPAGLTIDGDNLSQIFRVQGPSPITPINAALNHLTLTRGRSTGGLPQDLGGAVNALYANLSLERTLVTGNSVSATAVGYTAHATAAGGGLAVLYGSLNLVESVVSGNSMTASATGDYTSATSAGALVVLYGGVTVVVERHLAGVGEHHAPVGEVPVEGDGLERRLARDRRAAETAESRRSRGEEEQDEEGDQDDAHC